MIDSSIQSILDKLPHRYPFLMVDKLLEVEPYKKAVALKNVTVNEPYFTGHFPERPVMPGVMILEALAQCAGLLYFHSTNTSHKDGSIHYFTGIDKARFKQIVLPGDQLILEVNLLKAKRELWKLDCSATVNGLLACSAELMIMKKDNKQ